MGEVEGALEPSKALALKFPTGEGDSGEVLYE